MDLMGVIGIYGPVMAARNDSYILAVDGFTCTLLDKGEGGWHKMLDVNANADEWGIDFLPLSQGESQRILRSLLQAIAIHG